MVLFFNRDKDNPWDGKVSIYTYIKEQGESVDGTLPDNDEFWEGSKMRWVAGGLDGALGHHARPGEAEEEAQQLITLLAKHSRSPKETTRRLIYKCLIKLNVGSQIDALLDGIRGADGVSPSGLFHEAIWLAENAAHRNPVKFGIALLGLFENEEAKELLLTLGRHDEFTLYAAVAVMNGMEDSNRVLFQMAQQVHGWGKIHLVERLKPDTPEIKAWLLRYGCRNNVMYEYLAYICAVNGELDQALAAEQIDDELFDGAGDILGALLAGGPAEDISDYEQGPQAIAHYLRHARGMASTAGHLLIAANILDFLNAGEDEEVRGKRQAQGWTEPLVTQCREACEAILSNPKWEAIIRAAVESGQGPGFHEGVTAAKHLNIDVWDVLYAQLEGNPIQDSHYLWLMGAAEADRIGKLVAFAEECLPLERIASGPGEEMGFGDEFAPHRCLNAILQSLDRYEGMGRPLILAGLNSPVIRDRNMALRALEAWDADAWGEPIVHAVNELLEKEPEESVKERIQQLKVEKGQ